MIKNKDLVIIDPKDMQILISIGSGTRPSDIADSLVIRQPSLTTRLRRLEEAGFLRSEESKGTKHIKIRYYLTEQAQYIIDNAHCLIRGGMLATDNARTILVD